MSDKKPTPATTQIPETSSAIPLLAIPTSDAQLSEEQLAACPRQDLESIFRALCKLTKELKTRNEELCREFAQLLRSKRISLPELKMDTDAENVPSHWCHAENMGDIWIFSDYADGDVPYSDHDGWKKNVASAQNIRDQIKGLNKNTEERMRALRTARR